MAGTRLWDDWVEYIVVETGDRVGDDQKHDQQWHIFHRLDDAAACAREFEDRQIGYVLRTRRNARMTQDERRLVEFVVGKRLSIGF